jgi:dTMP kinase
VAAAFAALADAEPARFVRIDGHGAAADVHARVLASLAPLLEAAA